MAEIYSTTLKYFHLAISEFLPQLKELYESSSNKTVREQIEDLIEAYEDIDSVIESYGLNYEDPNRYYDGEPNDVNISISDEMIANLVQLSLRLLDVWKARKNRLERKKYLTDASKDEIYRLDKLIVPLDIISKESSYVLGKYAHLGPLVFPGEGEQHDTKDELEIVKTIKNKLKTEGLFIESRSQDEDLHLLIGKRDGTPDKAHAIVDGKTGEIRIEDNQKEPLEFVSQIESILTLPGGKKIRITREAIEELVEVDSDETVAIEKQKQLFRKNEENFKSGKNSSR